MERAPRQPAVTQRSPTTSEQLEVTTNEPPAAREVILNAVERLIAERGFASLKVTDIAVEARVSEDVFRGYFADKTALLRALSERNVAHMIATVDIVTRSGSWKTLNTRELMEIAVRSLMDTIMDRAAIVHAFLTHNEGELAGALRLVGTHLTERVADVLAEAKDGAALSPEDVAFALELCVAIAHQRVLIRDGWSGAVLTRDELAAEATRAVLGYLDRSKPA